MAELRIEPGILRARGSPICFPPSSPIYGGFVYLSFPRLALMDTSAGRLPELHGTLRGGKMAELQLESAILWIPASPFLGPPAVQFVGR